jgi:signal transduction histidine kinase
LLAVVDYRRSAERAGRWSGLIQSSFTTRRLFPLLAVAAHELRTPLATLTLLVDHVVAMLRASPTVDSSPVIGQGQQLTMLKRQVERLSALVVEMLDISRITSGSLDLVPGPVDLRDVVREVSPCAPSARRYKPSASDSIAVRMTAKGMRRTA